MDKRLKQLIQLAEEGNEEAASDIAKEFPAQYEKIFGIPMPKLVKKSGGGIIDREPITCLLYTSPSPRDGLLSRMPSSA